VIDTPAGMRLAVEHLVSLGHRDIAYAYGPENSWSNRARWQALKATGQSCERVGPFPRGRMFGSAAADALLNTRATAYIAFNDLLAIGILARLRERGVRVPGDVSVVGCDDIFGADFCNPPLTTLTAPIEQAGRVAVSLLLSHLDAAAEPQRRAVVLPTHLTIRESTGPAPSAV
jgi:LacI family transcriptional regulator